MQVGVTVCFSTMWPISFLCVYEHCQIAEKPQIADRPSRDFHLKSVLELQALARFSWVTVHGSKLTCVRNLCLWFVSCFAATTSTALQGEDGAFLAGRDAQRLSDQFQSAINLRH